MRKALIIGGGFGGCTAAQVLAGKGFKTILIEKAPFLGGGCKTHYWGGHPFTFGPRHFLTRKEHLFTYLHEQCPMRKLPEHEFWTYVERDQNFYHFPIHVSDIDRMPDMEQVLQQIEKKNEPENATNLEDYWVRSVGGILYSKFVETYSKKMWQVSSNRELDDFAWSPKGVALNTRDTTAAWTEAISAFPLANDGYDQFFLRATKDVEVHLNTEIQAFDLENKRVQIGGQWSSYDVIVNTLAPDTVLNGVFGPLRWIGRDFMQIVLPVETVFPKNVYFLYYANAEPFTRIVEYKKFYNNYSSPTTLLGLEVPSKNGKLYPMPTKVDQARAERYFSMLPEGVFSIGRAGSYRYDVDIDDIIEQSLEIGERV
jgi:UDP-galactopyranose mutase